MAAAALIGYGTLLALVFGVRTVIHRQRMGETGWLRPPTRVAWLGDGLFTLGVAAALAAPLLQTAGVLGPLGALDSPVVNAAGTALLVAARLLGTAHGGPSDVRLEGSIADLGIEHVVSTL